MRAYFFLRSHAVDRRAFSIGELEDAAGWRKTAVTTYLSKQWRNLIRRDAGGQLHVHPRFLHFSLDEFLRNFTQVRQLVAQYQRRFHHAIVSYEFLLPLTRERELRNALDSLFFRDNVAPKLAYADIASLQEVLPAETGETDSQYLERLLERFSGYFGGYSVVHVEGRFRGSDALLSRGDAGVKLGLGETYLIDETTASVRFIAPCLTGEGPFGEDFGSVSPAVSSVDVDQLALTREIALIRELFFYIFVEAVADSVRGEDEIWLIETTPFGQRLFKWVATR